jgi:hypothetical protein
MSFKPEKPYNDLPLLPPKAELETPATLKKAISANKALAELKGLVNVILVQHSIAERQAASEYLKALEQIGILESKKVGKETLYLNRALYEIFTR